MGPTFTGPVWRFRSRKIPLGEEEGSRNASDCGCSHIHGLQGTSYTLFAPTFSIERQCNSETIDSTYGVYGATVFLVRILVGISFVQNNLCCTTHYPLPMIVLLASSTITTIPPAIPLLAAATIHVTKIQSRFATWTTALVLEVVFSLTLQLLLREYSSIVPWWGPLTTLLSQWYRIDALAKLPVLQSLQQGPLGKGASKAIQVLVAILLWRLKKNQWPTIQLGPLPGPTAWMLLVCVSVAVNVVLYGWSRVTQSRGTHQGVDQMVQSSLERYLTIHETVQYATLALINAICEEVTSRWFWWQEFATCYENPVPNLAQAAIFGIWHYHGIPSGMTGVMLTFVYGWIMGELKERVGGGGLLLPILAHAIADYYIFTTIARGKATTTSTKRFIQKQC
jgi:membrane protease YdiL (CAAX protease family)